MKILVLSADKSHLEDIRDSLDRSVSPGRHMVLPIEGGIDRLAAMVDQHGPDVVVFDTPRPEAADLDLIERISLHHPHLAMVLLCAGALPELLIAAIRVGVRDVLQWPAEKAALIAAIQRIEQKALAGDALRPKAKILAFIACKGGSGSTFLAANFAYALAAEENKRVALLDLNLQFGDAVLFLSDHVPTTTAADVARNIGRLDSSLLAASMVHVTSNLSVLPAPESPERALDVLPEHIDVILKLAATQYDFIVIDVGRQILATSIKALDYADAIFPVLQVTLPFIRDAKRLIGTLESLGYPRQKIHLIVNRNESGGEIGVEDVERALDMSVYAAVPNSFKAVSASVNQGVPILKIAKHDDVSKLLRRLAHELVHGSDKKRSGWFAHFIRHA